MKINIKTSDYQRYNLGFNEFNFIKNIIPRISHWLLDEYNKTIFYNEKEMLILHNKLIKIAEIIDEEINE